MAVDNEPKRARLTEETAHESSYAKQETPAEAVMRMAGGFAMTQVLHTAVLAGIPDCMGDRSWTAREIADALHLDACTLERFLRMMVVLDLLVQVDVNCFRLSPAGQLLRRAHPQSMHERITYIGAINYPVASAAIHSLHTGRTAFEHVFDVPFFDYLAQKPELGSAFNGLMQRGAEARAARILEAADFSRASHVVDIGGGRGTLLLTILEKSEGSIGTIFDQPAVITEARRHVHGRSAEARVRFVEGDLFTGPYPAGADLYILSNIIHDWSDIKAESILKNCLQAMRENSELIIIEELLPLFVNESPSTTANDYSMLLLTGGMERREAQYTDLLARSGLVLTRTTPVTLHNHHSRRNGRWALMHCHAK